MDYDIPAETSSQITSRNRRGFTGSYLPLLSFSLSACFLERREREKDTAIEHNRNVDYGEVDWKTVVRTIELLTVLRG